MVASAVAASALVLAIGCDSTPGSQEAASEQKQIMPSPALQATMQAKMEHVDQLLRAISLRDFERIGFHATGLTALSEASDWQVHATVEYGIFSEQFRQSTGRLARLARSEDIAPVRAEYVRMLESCFQCHAYLYREGLLDDPTISQRPAIPAEITFDS
jgi:hypothetical protein